MIMAPNQHQSSTFSTWVSHIMCIRMCTWMCSSKRAIDQVYEHENINKTIQWARPLHTTIHSSQTRLEEGGELESIIRPTSFQAVLAKQTHADADNESLDSTIGYADTESVEESENSGDLVEEVTSRHLDGGGRQTSLSDREFEDGESSIIDTEICNRARSTSGTLRLNPKARILEDDESSHSSCSFLSLSPSGSNFESTSNRSTSSSVVRSPSSYRVGGDSSQLTGCSSRNLRAQNTHWTDREDETIYTQHTYLSTRKSPRESVSANSVSSSLLPSSTDTYDSEESSKSSCSTSIVGESRDPYEDPYLLNADKGDARRSIRELSQSIGAPVQSVANSTSGIEVLIAAIELDAATSIICEPVRNHIPPRTKLITPKATRRRITSQFKRTENQFRMIEKAKAESGTPEISKKVAQSPKAAFPRRQPTTASELKAKLNSRR